MTKVDIISGFLGAGKTTFIKRLVTDVFQKEQIRQIRAQIANQRIGKMPCSQDIRSEQMQNANLFLMKIQVCIKRNAFVPMNTDVPPDITAPPLAQHYFQVAAINAPHLTGVTVIQLLVNLLLAQQK